MEVLRRCACLALAAVCLAWPQQPTSTGHASQAKKPAPETAQSELTQLLESNITKEWEAFKKRDKTAYGDLLAEDFMAVEDDNQGQRTKSAAVSEIDRSVVNNYYLFAVNVIQLDSSTALVTYEITLQFPPTAVVRFKRVLVSEIWLKRNGQWKERYYQETHVR